MRYLGALLCSIAACGEPEPERTPETTATETAPPSGGTPPVAASEDVGLPLSSNGIGHDSGAFTGYRDRDPRKPTVSAVRMGAVSVTGDLPPELIQRVARQSIARLRKCYEAAFVDRPAISARTTTTFTIASDGRVSDAKTTGDLAKTDAQSCIEKELGALKYPAPESGSVKVSYPIVFAPPAYRFKIGEENSVDVRGGDVVKALEKAGYKVTGASAASQPGATGSRLNAEKGGITFSLTLDPTATMPLEDYEKLKTEAVMLEDGAWVLFVQSQDPKASRALLDAIQKKTPGR